MEKSIAYKNFIGTVKYLAANREHILNDDVEFTKFLCSSVEQNKLLPTAALYLYCSRFDIQEFILVDLQVKNSGERPAVLAFIDSIMAGQDISPLLKAIDIQRESEEMP